jgi:hypothetical protein
MCASLTYEMSPRALINQGRVGAKLRWSKVLQLRATLASLVACQRFPRLALATPSHLPDYF